MTPPDSPPAIDPLDEQTDWADRVDDEVGATPDTDGSTVEHTDGTTATERAAAAEKFLEYWATEYERLLAFAAAKLSIVRMGWATELDAVHTVADTWQDRLERAGTRQLLTRRLASYLKPGNYRIALRHWQVDEYRRLKRECPTDPEGGGAPDRPAPSILDTRPRLIGQVTSDEHGAVFARADAASVQLIVEVLQRRGQRRPRPATAWTERQTDLLRTTNGERGELSAFARRWQVNRSQATRDLKDGLTAWRRLYYLAGVLAPPGALSDPVLIDQHLDSHDLSAGSDPGTTADRGLLAAAAPTITAQPGRGERVAADAAAASYAADRPDLLSRLNSGRYCGDYLADFIELLHGAETRHAHRAQDDPAVANCVTICAGHNPNPDRIIWER